MPNIKSQEKRVKTAKAANERNTSRTSALKTSMKKAKNAIKNDSSDKEKLCADAVKALNQAGNHNILHKKNVSRKVSKLTKSMNKTNAKSPE
jgi:small subunit ribosomal protein S20